TAISKAFVHPNILKQLIKYHTSPSKLPIHELLKKPKGTCLTTIVHQKNIVITKIDLKQGTIEINDVLISYLDLFLKRPISIHGVLAPFSSLLGFDEIGKSLSHPFSTQEYGRMDTHGSIAELKWIRVFCNWIALCS
ncbi:hypothetical protein HYC85_014379, partial [Camellia sinensis]